MLQQRACGPAGLPNSSFIIVGNMQLPVTSPLRFHYTNLLAKRRGVCCKHDSRLGRKVFRLNLRKVRDNVDLDTGVWGVRICRRRRCETDFRTVEQFGLMENFRRFGWTCCINLVTVKLEVTRSSEPAVIFCQTARWHILENCVLHKVSCLQVVLLFRLMHFACSIQRLELPCI